MIEKYQSIELIGNAICRWDGQYKCGKLCDVVYDSQGNCSVCGAGLYKDITVLARDEINALMLDINKHRIDNDLIWKEINFCKWYLKTNYKGEYSKLAEEVLKCSEDPLNHHIDTTRQDCFKAIREAYGIKPLTTEQVEEMNKRIFDQLLESEEFKKAAASEEEKDRRRQIGYKIFNRIKTLDLNSIDDITEEDKETIHLIIYDWDKILIHAKKLGQKDAVHGLYEHACNVQRKLNALESQSPLEKNVPVEFQRIKTSYAMTDKSIIAALKARYLGKKLSESIVREVEKITGNAEWTDEEKAEIVGKTREYYTQKRIVYLGKKK